MHTRISNPGRVEVSLSTCPRTEVASSSSTSAAASTPDRVCQQIQDESILAHAFKMTMTVRNLQTQIANIKRRMGLKSSIWSTEANALRAWLLSPRVVEIPSSVPSSPPKQSLKWKILTMTRTIEELEGVLCRAKWDAERHEEIFSELKKFKAVLEEKGLEHLYENLP